jgi:hypothetical protein
MAETLKVQQQISLGHADRGTRVNKGKKQSRDPIQQCPGSETNIRLRLRTGPHPSTGHFTAAFRGTVSTVLPPAPLSSRLAVLGPHAPEGVKVTGTTEVSPGAKVIWSVGTEKLLASVPETLGTTVMGCVVMFLRVTFSTGGGSVEQYAKPPKSTVEGVAWIGD